MEPTYYLYSKFYGWIGVIFFGGVMLGMIYLEVSNYDSKSLLPLSIPFLLCAAMLYYVIRSCFIYAINGYIALELDEEKAHCYITDRTIYWKDVVEITEDYSQYSSYIKFEMIDGDTLTIPTKWITGSNRSICNKMQEYFARTL